MSEPVITIPARTALQIARELVVMRDAAALRGAIDSAQLAGLRSEWFQRQLAQQLTEEQLSTAMVANRLQEASLGG